MIISNIPIIEIPPQTEIFRTQLIKARTGTIRKNGIKTSPPSMFGRYSVKDSACAYFADSKFTALLEAHFRRDVAVCNLSALAAREISHFETTQSVRLAYLCGLEEAYPFLQATRYAQTQILAQRFWDAGLDGVQWASVQHPGHSCICLFQRAFGAVKLQSAMPLVNKKRKILLNGAIMAARRAGVVIVPD